MAPDALKACLNDSVVDSWLMGLRAKHRRATPRSTSMNTNVSSSSFRRDLAVPVNISRQRLPTQQQPRDTRTSALSGCWLQKMQEIYKWIAICCHFCLGLGMLSVDPLMQYCNDPRNWSVLSDTLSAKISNQSTIHLAKFKHNTNPPS